MREIRPIDRPDAEVAAPGSKSMTNRGLVLGALAEGETVLEGPLRCGDTVRLAECLDALGIRVRESRGGAWRVLGAGGRIPARRADLGVGESGTALRFLTALCALGDGRYRIDGEPGLRRRPVEVLCAALRSLGADVTATDGSAPVQVESGGPTGGKVSLSGEISSQFASSLLLVAPRLPRGLELTLTGTPVSGPYLDLTLAMMKGFGARVARPEARRITVEPGAYRGRVLAVEGDASTASYFFAAAAVTGGRVRVTNLPDTSIQGDLGMLEILTGMGAGAARGPDWAEVVGGPLRGIDADLRATPDLVPTVAAVGMVADGTTRIRGVPHLRVKESDRIEAIVAAVRALGGAAEGTGDGLVIEGGEVAPGTVDPRGDHRIAMAFSVLGLRRAGIRIEDPGVVGKSDPGFFERLASL